MSKPDRVLDDLHEVLFVRVGHLDDDLLDLGKRAQGNDLGAAEPRRSACSR